MADDDHETRDDSDERRRSADDAPLVERVRAGDGDAFGALYDRWFDQVLDLAFRILWDSEEAGDVAQDTFLAAWRSLDQLEDPHAFGGWLLRITRNRALDRHRRELHAQPIDGEQLAMIERSGTRPEDRIRSVDDPARVAEDASYVALLWDAADALGERDQVVVDLHLRHGLSRAEIGDVVGMDRNAANQLVHRVRSRLTAAVGARILWHSGQPACPALRAELVAADIEVFDADAVRVAGHHADACDECAERRRSRLSPAQMFAAIPILGLPALKAETAHALAAAGVPMGGSGALTGTAGGVRAGRRATRRPVPRAAIVGAAAALVVIAVVIITAVGLGHDARHVVAVSGTTPATGPRTRSKPTAVPSSSTSTTSTTLPATTTTATVAPAAIVPVTTPPTVAPVTAAPRTTTTMPFTVRYALEPDAVDQGYPNTTESGPVLTWSVIGARRVRVYDDADVFTSDKRTGSTVVCPDSGTGAVCSAPAGAYVYTLDAYDARGVRVLHRTLTLTIR